MKSTVLKRLLLTTAALVAVLMLFSVTAFAEDYGNFSYSPVESENDEFEPYNKITSYNAGDDATDTVVLIPSDIEDVPVTIISASAFSGRTNLTEVIIPDSITTIDNAAFKDCTSLEIVIIPDSVTSIGKSAFQGCTSLKYVIIGNGVKEIGDIAFKDCVSLEHLSIGSSVETVGSGAFYNCGALTKVNVPDSVQNIGSLAFGFCQNENTESAVSGFTFLTNSNAAVDAYNAQYAENSEDISSEATVFLVSAATDCGADAHSVDFVNARKATDAYEGVDIAQCSACLAVVTRANTDVEAVEKSFTDYISLIIGVIIVIACVVYILFYIKKAKAHREKAIAEYKAGKTLSDVELKNKAEAKAEAKYAKKRAKQEKRLEIFK